MHVPFSVMEVLRKAAVEYRPKLTDIDHRAWISLIDDEFSIEAIKAYRQVTGSQLTEAKRTVDHYRATGEIKHFWKS